MSGLWIVVSLWLGVNNFNENVPVVIDLWLDQPTFETQEQCQQHLMHMLKLKAEDGNKMKLVEDSWVGLFLVDDQTRPTESHYCIQQKG